MSGILRIAESYARRFSADYGTSIDFHGPFAVSAGSAITFYFEDDSFAEQDVGAPLPIVLVRQSGDVEELRGLSRGWFDVSGEIPDEWDGE